MILDTLELPVTELPDRTGWELKRHLDPAGPEGPARRLGVVLRLPL
jgi:hypothetical protein